MVERILPFLFLAIKTTPLYTSDYDLEGFGTPKFLPSGRIPKFTGAGPNPPVIRRQSKIRKWVQVSSNLIE
jgi:hypothetical protein